MADNGSAVQDAPRKRGRPRKGGQEKLIDLDNPKDKALIAAIKKYREARDDRMELTKVEVETQAALLTLMRDRGLTEYTHEGFKATLVEGKAKVKVKSLEDDSPDEDDE